MFDEDKVDDVKKDIKGWWNGLSKQAKLAIIVIPSLLILSLVFG